MSSPPKNLSREELVFLAKLYEKAERYTDMVKTIHKFVELDPKLTKGRKKYIKCRI